MSTALPYAFGGPAGSARVRVEPEHFRVVEIPICEPDGSGEHVWLSVRKRNANSEWVARQLARFAGVQPCDVSYAGLKDRHAVTEQWFSVQLPGKADPDWSALSVEGVQILRAERHSRKLKRGALRGNRFALRITGFVGDSERVNACLQQIATQGMPNYFGEQRFGRDGQNIDAARAMLADGGGRRLPRHTRGLYLSALRSHLFNQVLAVRITAGNWNQLLEGDLLQLNGSRAWFKSAADAATAARVDSLDVHPTGPLWGRGRLESAAAARQVEEAVLAGSAADCEALERAGLEQDRRALRVQVGALSWRWQGTDILDLSFELPAGSYATVLLRELIDMSDVTDAGEAE